MHVFLKNDIQILRKKGKEHLLERCDHFGEISENIINNIFQRMCPEITIPRKYVLNDHEKISIKESDLVLMDRAVQSYRLDTRQIDIVNRINRGNQLILACAGSGKSVLLISKCFKLASLNPGKDFLITCYNRNLNNYYQWAISQAGFTDKNVKCITFLGLCKQLLERNKIPLPTMRVNQENEYYNRLFEKANDALANGQIKERYYGIFIDEVQIFKPEWYRFCFNLLKSKNDTDHYFVIAGDKSQDIKNNIKRGKAPWQGGGKAYPEYRGKTLPIETNYRNSKPINEAIDRYVNCAKVFGKKIGVDFSSDPELFLRGTAYRPGNKPTIISLEDLSNEAFRNRGRSFEESLDVAENRQLASGTETDEVDVTKWL
jgi:superfamily I DNA/RNA helicase